MRDPLPRRLSCKNRPPTGRRLLKKFSGSPTNRSGMTLHVEGLGWHGPIPVVGAPNRSYDYGVVAPPRAWGRGIPNAAHCTSSTAFWVVPLW